MVQVERGSEAEPDCKGPADGLEAKRLSGAQGEDWGAGAPRLQSASWHGGGRGAGEPRPALPPGVSRRCPR